MKLKQLFLGCLVVTAINAIAAPTIENIVAKQRFPWNGLVDIKCKVVGIEKSAQYKFYVEAVLPDEGITNEVSQFWVVQNGTKQSNFKVTENGDYSFVWDAKADLGTIRCTNMTVCVGLKDGRDKVQLWEGGPYWATTNIGAEEPWDSGYYFWWGDTVGYKREKNKWVASDGSSSNFFFKSSATPTYNKNISDLESEGWIVLKNDEYVLALEYDAAHMHWGGIWRMPSKAEIDALRNKCNINLATTNGIRGYIVSGKGEYASNSIFIPCTGVGQNNEISFNYGGQSGYWSSVPATSSYNDAFNFGISSTMSGYSFYTGGGKCSLLRVLCSSCCGVYQIVNKYESIQFSVL